jgi:hypothetical protein
MTKNPPQSPALYDFTAGFQKSAATDSLDGSSEIIHRKHEL